MTSAAVSRIAGWLPKLTAPIRIGEHSQTAFAFGLMLDWARATGEKKLESLLLSRSRDFYLKDRACPLAYEPSGEDFLSPCVAEADLMRRVLPEAEFTRWLSDFLPSLPTDGLGDWLAPRRCDRSHRSPTWASVRPEPLAGVDAPRLPGACRRPIPAGRRSWPPPNPQHRRHDRRQGGALEGGHWLGTFAVYSNRAAGYRPARDGRRPARDSSPQFPLPLRVLQPLRHRLVVRGVPRPTLRRAVPAMVRDGHVDTAIHARQPHFETQLAVKTSS